MPKPTKSLSEQINELYKPQTDFDIEDDRVVDADSEQEASGSDEDEKTTHYVKVGKSNLANNEPKIIYDGKKASRSEIFGDEEDASEEISEESGSDEQLDDHESDSDSGISLEGAEAESESDAEPSDDEEKHKRSQLQQLIAKERQAIGSRVAQSNISDALKGYSITQQNKLFDQLIETRIKLHKSVTSSNLLPQNKEIAQEFITSNTKKALKRTYEQAYTLLESIIELRNRLGQKDGLEVVSAPKKRKISAFADTTSSLDRNLAKYRASTLTRWSSKVQNSSGATALNASKFKVVNQSAEQQVLNNLRDLESLKQRTTINRSNVAPLGYVPEDEDSEQDDSDENPDLPKNYNKNNRAKKNQIPQIFDDEDFYRILLNDLVDKKVQSNNPATGIAITLRSAQKAQKSNKGVDTRASKGRKLRYHIQEPIEHFENPIPKYRWEDNQIDEFFASLLGRKINMNEAESDEEAETTEVTVNDDSIKLFG